MKIVVNNLKKTKDDQFSDYLKLKWETKRDSGYSNESDSETVRKIPGDALPYNRRSKKSSKSL